MPTRSLLCISMMLPFLAACGSDEKTTVIHEKPVIVQPASGGTPSSSEENCKHGYDNDTHSCY